MWVLPCDDGLLPTKKSSSFQSFRLKCTKLYFCEVKIITVGHNAQCYTAAVGFIAVCHTALNHNTIQFSPLQ